MRTPQLLFFLIAAVLLGCNASTDQILALDQVRACDCAELPPERPEVADLPTVRGAMMATRFNSLEAFEEVVKIEYFAGGTKLNGPDPSADEMRITQCSSGKEVASILKIGVTEGDIKKARDGGMGDKLSLGFSSPYTVASRRDLQTAFILSRRRPNLFGEGDPAFFDLAEAMVAHINTEDIAFQYERDSSEKGYINTINHMTAQAFLTTIFSEEMADFIADLHERKHMPELINGQYTEEQLAHPENNPVDNLVDMINNEWGQELGNQLAEKYQLNYHSRWTAEVMTLYLNDLQAYFSWAFQIGFRPFRPDEAVVVRFADKLNFIAKEVTIKME